MLLERAARKKPLAIFCLAALLASCENPIIRGWFEEESVQANIVEKDVPPAAAAPSTGVALSLHPAEPGEYRAEFYVGAFTAATFAAGGDPAFVSGAFTVGASSAFIPITSKDRNPAAPDPNKTYAMLIKDKNSDDVVGYFNVRFVSADGHMVATASWPDMWRVIVGAESLKEFMEGLDPKDYDNHLRPYRLALSGISMADDLSCYTPYYLYGLLNAAFTYSLDFRGCTGESFSADYVDTDRGMIADVYLPEGLTSIDIDAFLGCSNLATVKFPSSLKEIGDLAFAECYQLRKADFTDCAALETIGDSAFYGSGLTSVDFTNCEALKTIGGSAFAYSGLTSVDFTNCAALKTIGKEAFYYCRNLESVNFTDCEALTKSGIGASAFSGTPLANRVSGLTDDEELRDHLTP
jgi:hypothetical protein